MRLLLLGLALAVGACIATACDAAGRPASADEVAAIRVAMQLKLKDADAAKFKDVTIGFGVDDKVRQIASVCGMVNSTNSFGAYTGFTWFAGALRVEPETSRIRVAVIGIDDDEITASRRTCADQESLVP